MTRMKWSLLFIALVLFVGIAVAIGRKDNSAQQTVKPPSRPALSVTVIQPIQRDISKTLTANGSIAAWQDAIIGAEVSGLRLVEVYGQVGDAVRKGDVLAVFDNDSVLSDIAQSKAFLAEAEANLEEARLNAQRARQAAASKVLSSQQVSQYLTSEKTALAKMQSAKAQLNNQLLRQEHTRVIASDDGTISSRTATLGAVAASGQELFRLIRKNRLEWRAEVTAAEMAQLKPGLQVWVMVPNVGRVEGKVRVLAPTLDTASRNGLAYVDLQDASAHGLRTGMFAQGEFNLGNSTAALTIPQDALSLREGFNYVFRLSEEKNNQAQVSQVKVQLGQRLGANFEILSGVSYEDKLVASGAAFLADGDSVRVVQQQ